MTDRGQLPPFEQDAHVRKVSRMVPADGPLTDKQIDEIVAAVQQHLREFDISQADVAKALGTNDTYISWLLSRNERYLSGASRDKLARQLNDWIEDDYQHRQTKRPENFVRTRVAELIFQTAQNARHARLIAVVTGSAGMGKTATIQAIAAEVPGTLLVTVDYDCRGARGLLDRIMQTARLRRKGRSKAKLADLVERLRGTGRLLIIDQAHDLRDDAFPLLMNLHDQCELPILLVGTKEIHDRVKDNTDVEFGQMSSRIGLRVNLLHELSKGKGGGQRQLQWISVPEIRKIFERKLKLHPDSARMLAAIANATVGHLRRVKHIMRLAEAIARSDRTAGAQILVAHVRRAIELVEGHDVAPPPPSGGDEVREAATA